MANSWRSRALGLAAAADAQLAEPAPGRSLRRPRSRRLHDGRRGRRADRSIRRARPCPGSDGHERHLGAAHRGRLPDHDEPRRDPSRATVVIASGACNQPTVPAFAAALPPDVEQLTPFAYRNPAQLPDGGVLVVGASATGVQLAAELSAIGTAGDPLGRGARATAADVSRPRRPLVDGRVRRLGPALRRGRRSLTGAAAAVAAARRDARADDARPQRARRRWASSWSAAGRPSVTAARSSRAVCETCARSPT